MRTRFILVAVVSLLFCSLCTLETQELVKLADDTSNDFSLLTHQQDVSVSFCNPSPVARLKTSRRRPIFGQPTIQLRFASSSRIAQELLHLLCIQRT